MASFKCLLSTYPELSSDGKILRCDACEIAIKCDPKHRATRVREHIHSKTHVKNKEKKRLKQSFIKDSMQNVNKKNMFNCELSKAFLSAGIPLKKLNNPSLKWFLKKHFGHTIDDESNIRKYSVPIVYKETIQKIKSKINGNPVYIILDETRDIYGRFILNFLVGVLNGEESKSLLYKTTELKEPANNENISREFMKSLQVIFNDNTKYEDIWLVVTDQAKYNIKCFDNIKKIGLFPNLKHITCLAHCLHRVSEKIRKNNYELDQLIGQMKILLKAFKMQKSYKQVTGLSLPPKVVLTRWGTWLTTAFYYSENYDKIYEFISSQTCKNKSFQKLKRLIASEIVRKQMIEIQKYKFLPKSITRLENPKLSYTEQWEIIKDAKINLEGEPLKRLEESLSNNPDLLSFISDNTFSFKYKAQFAPLVSVDCERSFSILKFLLSDKPNMTIINLEMQNIIRYNNKLE